MTNGISAVTLVKEWVSADLSSSSFSNEERKEILDDLEEDLVTWNRPLHKCLSHIENTGEETVYRRRIGDLRAYYVRRGNELYCIGAGKRRNTYDRDLRTITNRAEEI